MVVNVTPSGKAPPGRLRSWVGAMALVTAFPAAARGSHADNSARPGAAGPRSAHAGLEDPWSRLAVRIPHHTNT